MVTRGKGLENWSLSSFTMGVLTRGNPEGSAAGWVLCRWSWHSWGCRLPGAQRDWGRCGIPPERRPRPSLIARSAPSSPAGDTWSPQHPPFYSGGGGGILWFAEAWGALRGETERGCEEWSGVTPCWGARPWSADDMV